jgi:hypothetical protein
MKSLNGRQARWAITLAGYDFVIVHRPSKKNPADAPSRRPDYAPSMREVNEQASLLLPTLQRKLAMIRPSSQNEQVANWIDKAMQELQ